MNSVSECSDCVMNVTMSEPALLVRMTLVRQWAFEEEEQQDNKDYYGWGSIVTCTVAGTRSNRSELTGVNLYEKVVDEPDAMLETSP